MFAPEPLIQLAVGSTWVSGKEGIQEILQCVPFLYSLHFEPGAYTMDSKTKFKCNKPKLNQIAKLLSGRIIFIYNAQNH
jgi:hypothetical protein